MPLSTMSYSTRSLVAPRFLGSLTADMREEDEMDSAVTYDKFQYGGHVPESNGNGQMTGRDLYFAGRDTEKMVV